MTSDAAPPAWQIWVRRATTVAVLGWVWWYLSVYFKHELLLLDTMDAGGDTPSFHHPIHHLKHVLLPAGNPQGWDLGNFAGYSPYQFYFLPPALLIVLLSTVLPFYVSFKLVTALGVFLLPLCSWLAMRGMGFRFPVPLVAAAASLVFLFNEGNSMWGGNIPSTLAGEFAHSIGFSLSILFLGALYWGVESQRGWRRLGVLLALTGLCHPVAFLNATAPGVFFLLGRRHFARNARFIFAVYGTGVLLMGFWLVPVIAKLGYATSINWKWHFQTWGEMLPPVLYPVAILALLDAVWVAVFRRAENRPAYYLLVSLVATVLCFFNATEVGLPEIRFVPFTYMLMLFLAVDFVRRVVPLHLETKAAGIEGIVFHFIPHIGALALCFGISYWVQQHTTFVDSWIKWNYSGLQQKPSWGLLEDLTTHLRGTIDQPRVAYENSPKHDRFGSMRVFESLPHLSGRATLEGVLLQTAVNSPFIYWLQSQISKQGTGVIPGYSYPTVAAGLATRRLELFNAHDMITITAEVEQALLKHPRWERTFHQKPYSVFHLKNADPHYVRVPRFEPVLVETDDWKHTFHRWFATDEALDIPLVLADTVPADERARFAFVSTDPSELTRQPIRGRCEIEESIDHMEIRFTTTCPGKPHWISVSYFPNWRVEGAKHVFLASPAFMMVYPDQPTVTLRYQRIGADWLGIACTLLGIVLCLVPLPAPRAVETVDRGLTAAHPVLVPAATVLILAFTAWSFGRDFGPSYFYQRGWAAFSSENYDTAVSEFDWAIRLGGDTNTAGDATFFRAASLLRSGDPTRAMEGYRDIPVRFPASIWVAESIYHVGLCLRQLGRYDEATTTFTEVIDGYPGNRWAGFAGEQIQQMRDAGQVAPAPPPAPEAG
jgi:hypothetical protein